MRKVSIIGIGSTKFGKLEGVGIKELAAQACLEALADANLPREKVQAFYLGNYIAERLVGQGSLAPMAASALGLKRIPTTKVEGACASGGIAFRHAYLLVALGLYDFVLACGVEKMTSVETPKVTEALATGGDQEAEMRTGLTFPGTFAILMRRHMYEHGTTREQIGLVSVKNHRNSILNPKSQFQKPVTLEEVLSSRLIADPIRLYDCPPISDGAAALVLCPAEMAYDFHPKPIDILGSGCASGPGTLYEMRDLTTFDCTVEAAQEAYEMAGLSPQDIDVAEVHDCFTIAEIMAIEDLGFFEKGKGGPAVEERLTEMGGRIPVNPSGGLLSKGHPVGATGAAQLYEVVKQLRSEAGNQVEGAEIGLAQNLGGTGAICTVHILKRRI